jgi:signal transduction histidine kinase
VLLTTRLKILAGLYKDSSRRRYIPVALALGAVIIASIALFYIVRERDLAIRQAEFERRASAHVTALQRGIERLLEVVESIGGLYAASNNMVARDDFQEFVKAPLSRHAEIQALEWIPRVKDSDRALYEAVARKDGFADFQFTERKFQGQMVRALPRAEYFPVYYVEPLNSNEASVGFDLGSNPARLQALARARDTGEIVASARITLVQETGEQSGILIFRPVYRSGTPDESVQARRQNLRGYAIGVFRIGDMVDEALQDLDVAGLDILLYDDSAPIEERFLYLHQSRSRRPTDGPADEEQAGDAAGLRLRAALNVPGRQWSAVISPAPEFLAAYGIERAWEVLAGGLSFATLLGAYLLNAISRTNRIERLATELSKSNEELESNITERKRAEVELRSFAAKVERSNRELEEFAFVAAHDLQEPLRKILTFGDRLKTRHSSSLDDEAADHLERMRDAAQRMRTLINDLLTYSRVTTKGVPFVQVDLARIVREVVDDLEARIEEVGGRVEVGELASLEADPTQMRQLMQNLISNGLKFHRTDEPAVVKIRSRLLNGRRHAGDAGASANGLCQISVEDNGIGFDEKYVSRIFTIFQRLHGRHRYEGTGVGLAVCRKITDRHGGTIEVKSTPGRGSTFIVTLPTKQSDEQDRAHA